MRLLRHLGIAAVLTGAGLSFASARGVAVIPYQQRVAESDLVVIAQPVSSRDTGEQTALLMNSPALGVETVFEVEAVWKGENTERILLHHYRMDPAKNSPPNAAMGAWFNLDRPRHYLLFLKKEATSNRYVPLTGQDDPLVNSIILLTP